MSENTENHTQNSSELLSNFKNLNDVSDRLNTFGFSFSGLISLIATSANGVDTDNLHSLMSILDHHLNETIELFELELAQIRKGADA